MKKSHLSVLGSVLFIVVLTVLLSLSTLTPTLSESPSTLSDNSRHDGPAPAGLDAPQSPYEVSTLPDEASNQWGLGYLSVENIWSAMGGDSTVVAILDTGIDANHPDLSGKVSQEVNFSSSPTADDIYGHGTHIAGIIAASLDGQGSVGVDPFCRLLNVKVAEDDGTCKPENVSRGIRWAVDHNASVINISLQLSEDWSELENAVEYAAGKGVFVVAASGNNTPGEPVYPACYNSVISVTAITPEGALAPLANIADWVDIAAPGYQIYSTVPGGLYARETGTSFAAAHVSGFVALLCSLAPEGATDRYEQTLALIDRCSRGINLQGYTLNNLRGDLLEPGLQSETSAIN